MLGLILLAYNEERYIVPALRQWEEHPEVVKKLVLISERPWNGSVEPRDRTAELARQMGATVIIGDWKTEEDQRNFGLKEMMDCEFVFTLDPDEFLTKRDREKLIAAMLLPKVMGNGHDATPSVYRAEKMVTFWKDIYHVFSPADEHQPVIAVDPGRVRFTEHRNAHVHQQPIIDVILWHLSWVRTDDEVKRKIESYSHAKAIPSWWFKDVWLAGRKKNVRPYGSGYSDIVECQLPMEILYLL